jgi:O-acetyl-ADP-ribose deacetylase (regulator of RNase III)
MIIEELKEDILKVSVRLIGEGHKVVLLHGCNCFHTMGGGIALYLKNKYPEIYEADLITKYGDREKLGGFSYEEINNNLTIANCYTQHGYGNDRVYVESDAIFNSVSRVCEYYPNHYILMPKIGCGLAGGDWKEIKPIINSALKNKDAVVCYI